MPRILRGLIAFRFLMVALPLLLAQTSLAETVWSGLTFSFTRPSGVDGTQPQYQDFITTNAILARGFTGGLYNASIESGFSQGVSPDLTEWATDLTSPEETINAANWSNLIFTDWLDAYGGAGTGGSNIANRGAVLHLIPEDIYLDIHFTSWISHSGNGFSYMRAEPPAQPSPTGDYNGNGLVDAADYTIWRDTLGQLVEVQGAGADGDESGQIDTGDYTFWKLHFGETAPEGAGAAAAVPEPSLIAALIGALVLLGGPRRISLREPK